MDQIKCPKCGTIFQVDENDYAAIVKQVRDNEFENELTARVSVEREAAVQKALLDNTNDFTGRISAKDKEIAELNLKLAELQSASQKSIASITSEKQLIENTLSQEKERKANEIELAVEKALKEQNSLITELRAQLSAEEALHKSTLAKLTSDKELEIQKLQGELSNTQVQSEIRLMNTKESYEFRLKAKDEEIAQYKDYKSRLSTKMVGESLERYCQDQFNQLRATAFKGAYFEKDNDARTGSKGDFIFRDSSEGEEYISIMFEMKNQSDTTGTKHRNEDFFAELDKDRREKKCEYAVLVSLLEPESDFYNVGIADVSYRYEKMYVIRPQFFIPLISLLRDAALNSLSYRKQLTEIRNQNIDISNFESSLNDFKDKFGKNYRLASEKFKAAIDEIDKSILHLQKIKDNLISSENNLRLANDKVDNLTVKKLTRNNPTMKAKFDALSDSEDS